MTKLFGGNSNNSAFADRKQLAADKTTFCIEGARLVTQRDGKERWYLTIFLQKDGELVEETLTFDHSPSRDRKFQDLNSSSGFPIHNCRVDRTEFKGRNSGMMQTFYDIDVADNTGSCPCGDLAKKADEVEAPDIVPTPF